MLRAMIVEDEKHNRETLKNLIAEFCPEVEVAGMAASVEEAVPLARALQPDLLFLDIELPTGTGFDLLALLPDLHFEVIFTTAFERYALRAIKMSSLDYLLKPIDPEELQAAVAKALSRKSSAEQKERLDILLSHLKPSQPTENRICLATAEGLEFVFTPDIRYCEADGSYTHFYLKSGRKITVSKNLKTYETLLDPAQFMRVHHGFLINLKEVRRYVKAEGGYIVMNDDARIGISPARRAEFMSRMGL